MMYRELAQPFRRAYTLLALFILVFAVRVQAAEYDAKLLRLTNAERQKTGLPPLCLSSVLGQAAQSHARDMVRNNYFSHTGLDGSSPRDRVSALMAYGPTLGENLYVGLSTPEEVIAGWMNSQAHRVNILDAKYTEIGFGYAYDATSSYGHYWVQVFGKPSGASTCL